jgi:hypothetical protein
MSNDGSVATGELMRVSAHHLGDVGDLDLGEHGGCPLGRFLAPGAGDLEDFGHLPADADGRVQGTPGLLVHHGHRFGAELA